MDRVLDFVVELYRAAQEVPPAEMQGLALTMLAACVPFRSATWTDARLNPGVELFGLYAHNEPTELPEKFVELNARHRRSIEIATSHLKVAQVIEQESLYSGREHAPFRDYVRHYGHEHNMLIGSAASPIARGDWLSLYRPRTERPFEACEARLLTLLMPHLVEAVRINRALHAGLSAPGRPGARALMLSDGLLLHAGQRFLELVALEWPQWDRVRLPAPLLKSLLTRSRSCMASGAVLVTTSRIGKAWLLEARAAPLTERLPPRAHAIARLFATGLSYRQIAQELCVATATVRNSIAQSYARLGIHDKTELARLFAADCA